jgi:hypothetical protein
MSKAIIGRVPAMLVEEFQEQAFLHLDAIYADACCLTGNREDAADLVVGTYARAFHDYAVSRYGRGRRDTLV